jgi:hypothetical protein
VPENLRVGGCADALRTVDVTDPGGSTFLHLPGNVPELLGKPDPQ